MKLALLLVLAMLAVFCHPATASPCELLQKITERFLFGSVDDFMDAVSPFITTPAMNAMESSLKKCVQASVTDKQALALLLTQIFGKC